VALPGRDFELTAHLGALLQARASIREYQLQPLALDVLGRLLHASFGVRGYRKVDEQWSYDRPFPSAGGLYPLELYVATQQVAELADGIYHYDARAHALELLRPGRYHDTLADLTIEQHVLRDANLVILLAAVFQRTQWKYGQRGYRYVWIEAGHVAENIYLVAAALGLGPVAIGGFFDEQVNRLVGLPRDEEDVIYLMCIGQPRGQV
jgi:SagB-type dehydrogenase family enzyme